MSESVTSLARHRPARWLGELRSNWRALAGLAIIFLLIVAEGFLLLRDATERARADSRRELAQLERIDAIARERDWPQRAESSSVLRAALEDRLWSAESEGLARADLQGWIAGVAREIGLSTLDIRIELAAPKNLPANLRQITAAVTAQPSEAALVHLLQRIDTAPHLVVVERLDVKQVPAPFLDMTLTAYARIGPPSTRRPIAAGGGDPQ